MAIPGFDGSDYVIEMVRDFSGRGKREIYRRMHYDVVEKLYKSRQRLLALEQREAAVRLQVDDQLAATATLARSGGGRTGGVDFLMSEAVLEARRRVRAAERFLARDWPVTNLVVLCNLALGQTERCLQLRAGNALVRLRNGLDRLGDFYARV